MDGSRKDRRARERLETKVARRALPILKDNPVRAAIRLRYAMRLADGARPEDVLAGAYGEADEYAARLFAGSSSPACAAGCSHCCEHLPVGLSATEAAALANHVRQLPVEQREGVRERIAVNAARAKDTTAGTYPKMTCAFLDEEKRRCTVYDDRPLVCRRAHSFDVDRCRRAADGERVDIMVDARVIAMYSQIGTALREASAAFGGDTSSYELHQAVDILLGDPHGDLSPAREKREKSDEASVQALSRAVNAALHPERFKRR